jgi:ketosteroid isomerase-like protein
MAEQDVSMMRRAYEAFNQGDIPGALAAFDPQVEWHEPGGGRAPGGTFQGSERVANEVFSTIPQNFSEFRAEPDAFIDAADRLVVTGHFRGRTTAGQSIDVPFAHVWELRNGKAVRFQNYVDAARWTTAWSD